MGGEESSDGLSADRKVEIRVRKNGRKDKVIVEKSGAEGLPKGWIKKLVITIRTGRKNRRDPFFIDPKREYIFQSFKDASRYVETGDIGIYARKMKESDLEDDDSGNKKTVFLLESGEKKRSADALLEKETNMNTYVRNLSSCEERSENCKMNPDLSNVTSQVHEDPIEKHPIAKRVTRSQAKAIDVGSKRKNPSSSHTKLEEDSVKSRLVTASSQDSGTESVMEKEVQSTTEKWITRNKANLKKNELSDSVVRRTSKRLAGIELEPTPELKIRDKAQRVVPPIDGIEKPLNPVGTSTLKETGIPLKKEVANSCNEHISPKPNAAATSNTPLRAEPEVKVEKTAKAVGRNLSLDKKKMKSPLVMVSETELNPVFHLDGYNQKEKMSPVSPLYCQTTATKFEKTAAGKRLRRSSPNAKLTRLKATEISPLGSSNKGACSELMEKNTNSFSSTFDSTLADLWKDPCIAFAIKTLTGGESLHTLPNTTTISSDPKNNHAKQKGVTSELPCVDICRDPCIDFAIKTLTGAIPIGLDAKSKPEEMTNTVATQEQECRQGKQCSSNMNDKTVVKPEDLKFSQSFSKD